MLPHIRAWPRTCLHGRGARLFPDRWQSGLRTNASLKPPVAVGAAQLRSLDWGNMIPVSSQPWRTCLLSASAAVGLLLAVAPAWADADDALAPAAVAGEVAHKQKMGQLFRILSAAHQATPPVIPQLEIDPDPSGLIATYQPNGATVTATNPFFQNLGTNGRTCFTCHEPQDGWGLSAQHAQDRFAENPTDPLFRLVDGATCPSDDVFSLEAMRKAYSLVLSKGLIRIGLPMQSSMQFQILSVDDPYGCNTNPTTGLTGAQSGTASFYRRPLPSANLGFLSTIMWDGREPSLFKQAVDATLDHAQGNTAPSPAQQQQIVLFEGCSTAFTPAVLRQHAGGRRVVYGAALRRRCRRSGSGRRHRRAGRLGAAAQRLLHLRQ